MSTSHIIAADREERETADLRHIDENEGVFHHVFAAS